MNGEGIHTGQAAEGLRHESRDPILMTLASLDPLIKVVRSWIPEEVKIHRLRFGDHRGVPRNIGRTGQPVLRVRLLHYL